MNVLHVGPKNYPPAHGGVEKSVFDLANNLAGVKSYIAVEWEQPAHESVIIMPKGIIKRISELKKYSQKKHVDVLHFNKEAFIPLAIYFHLFTSYGVVLSVRGCAWRLSRWPFYIRFALYMLDLLACLFLPKIAFVSLRDFKHFAKIIFWKKMFYVPNGIAVHQCMSISNKRNYAYLGRISPEKNIIAMIRLFSKLDASLVIYGPFDKHNEAYGSDVMKEIKKTSNVTYGGVVTHDKIFITLSNYVGFVNISFSEGMPVAVLEAASVGLHLILSDIPQHRDLGFKDAIYLDLKSPVLSNSDLKSSPSIDNRSRAFDKYSVKKTAEIYRNIYMELSNI